MKLPVPFTWGNRLFTDIETGRVRGGVMADTKAEADKGNYFGAVLAYLVGVTETMTTDAGDSVSDKGQLRSIIREMPSVNSETAALLAMGSIDGNEFIEGVYECPLCGKSLVCEGETADLIEDMDIGEGEADERFSLDLSQPVDIQSRKKDQESVLQVRSFIMRHPTVEDYLKAFGRVGTVDQLRFQFSAYSFALLETDGEERDERWRSTYGPMLFADMDRADLNKIGKWIRSRGLAMRLPKACNSCGKKWDAEVSGSGFFASALGSSESR